MNLYIGYDSRESICYDTCRASIEHNATKPVPIAKLSTEKLNHIYDRPVDPTASTEFAYTRFLVPHLNNYKGWALFCDCDFIFLDDVLKLFDLCDHDKAIMVCKHDYKPTNTTKMDGKVQSVYPRKNWSSLVLWNCDHPANKTLNPTVVSNASGKYLHRFEWLKDSEIGEIPIVWNWLVGWYKEPRDGTPRALHYTEGGPWFDKYVNCEYSQEWYKYREMCCSR